MRHPHGWKRSASRGQLLRALLGAVLLALAGPVAADDVVYKAGDPGVAPPVLRVETRVDPEYPEGSSSKGRVVLQVLVDVDGKVAGVEPLRIPYGGEELGKAAEAAVRKWRYEPATLEGRPVACWVVASVEFYPSPPPPPPSRNKGKTKGKKGTDDEPVLEPIPMPGASRSAASDPEPTPLPPPARSPEAVEPETSTEPRPSSEPELSSEPEPSLDPQPAAVDPAAATGDDPATPGVPAAPPATAPKPPVGDRAIDPTIGGPAPLLIGAQSGPVEAFLASPAVAGRIEAREQGIEVTLGEDGTVVAIRYVYRPGDGFLPARWRTRSGLGSNSFCLGIPPAHGRPESRSDGDDGVTRLVYRGESVRATFSCVGGRLTELLLELAAG